MLGRGPQRLGLGGQEVGRQGWPGYPHVSPGLTGLTDTKPAVEAGELERVMAGEEAGSADSSASSHTPGQPPAFLESVSPYREGMAAYPTSHYSSIAERSRHPSHYSAIIMPASIPCAELCYCDVVAQGGPGGGH